MRGPVDGYATAMTTSPDPLVPDPADGLPPDPPAVEREPDAFTEGELADDGARPVPLVPEAEQSG